MLFQIVVVWRWDKAGGWEVSHEIVVMGISGGRLL